MRDQILELFPTAACFANYVDVVRKERVRTQKWCRTYIHTLSGVNATGMFRDFATLLRDEVTLAGGLPSVLQYEPKYSIGVRIWSSPRDSDSMRLLCESKDTGMPIIAFEAYADGTTMARSGTQSLNIVRIRFMNLRGRNEEWHELAIATVLEVDPKLSSTRLAEERTLLLQRFLFLIFRSMIDASNKGICVNGQYYTVRLALLVCDQPQERSLLCLKRQARLRIVLYALVILRRMYTAIVEQIKYSLRSWHVHGLLVATLPLQCTIS